jgi:hypothetical protein
MRVDNCNQANAAVVLQAFKHGSIFRVYLDTEVFSVVSSATHHVRWMTKLACVQDSQSVYDCSNISRKTLSCKHRGGKEVCTCS